MNSICQSCFLLCALFLITTATPAQQPSAPHIPPTGTYLGRIVLEDPTGIEDLVLKVDSYTPQEDLKLYEEILSHKKEGQQELLNLLNKHREIGQFRLGSGLNSGSGLSFALRLIAAEPTRKGFHVVLVGNRFTLSQGRRAGPNPQEFHFTVFTFDVDAKGDGDGIFHDGAKLRFNKKHGLEVWENLENPLTILKVHLDTK